MEFISFINLLSRGFTSNRLMLSLGPIYCDYSLKDIVINCLVTKEHNSFNIIVDFSPFKSISMVNLWQL